MTGRVLIADDQPDVLEALRLLLKGEGFEIESAASPMGILAALETRDFDVVLMDLNYTRDTTSGQEGLDTLMRIQAIDANVPVVVMTAWGSVELAVEAMRRGARDFIQKPWDNARLMTIVRTQVELSERSAARAEAGGRKSSAADRRTADADRRIAGDAAGTATDFARGSVGCECADHGRAGDGQRSGRADAAHGFAAASTADGDGERRAAWRKGFSRASCSAT